MVSRSAAYQDFAEFIRILNRHRIRFVAIGGYAVAFHGAPRATDDVDVLIEQTSATSCASNVRYSSLRERRRIHGR